MAAASRSSRQAAAPVSVAAVNPTAHQSSRPLDSDNVSDLSDSSDIDDDPRVSGNSNSRSRNMQTSPLTNSRNSQSQTTRQTSDLQSLHNQTLSAKDREAQEEAAKARKREQTHHVEEDEDDDEDRLVPLASVPDTHRHNSSQYPPYSSGSPPQGRPFLDTHLRRQSTPAQSPPAQTQFAQETTPLLNHPPGPPPAYSPSETTSYNTMPSHGPIYLPENNQGAQHNSQAPNNVPEYQQSLLPHHHRENSNNGTQFSFTWRRNKDPRKRGNFRKWLTRSLKLVLGLVLLGALLTFVINLILGFGEISRGNDNMTKPHSPKDTLINEPKFPDQLAERSCLAGVLTKSTETSLPDARSLQFLQKIKQRTSSGSGQDRTASVSGTIYIHELTDDAPTVYIKTQYFTSHEELYSHVVISKAKDYFELQIPDEISANSARARHCMYVRTDIYLHKSHDLSSVVIETDRFNIVFDGPSDFVTSKTELTAISGDILAWFPAGYDSRSVTVRTSSGDIRGTYPLYDFLKLTSISGDIVVDVSLKNASDYSVMPASYSAYTSSGQLKSNTLMTSTSKSSFDPAKDAIFFSVPDRNYISSFQTISGDINIQHLHGTDTKIETTSGDITTTLIPYGDPSLRSNLRLSSISGDMKSRVLSSLSHRNRTLDHFEATYKTSSGDVKLIHPAEFSGLVKAHTWSGDLRVSWPGLDLRKINHGKELEGHKGDGEGWIEVSTMSGDIDLRSPKEGEEKAWAKQTEESELARAVKLAKEREQKEKERELNGHDVLLGSPWMDKWAANIKAAATE